MWVLAGDNNHVCQKKKTTTDKPGMRQRRRTPGGDVGYTGAMRKHTFPATLQTKSRHSPVARLTFSLLMCMHIVWPAAPPPHTDKTRDETHEKKKKNTITAQFRSHSSNKTLGLIKPEDWISLPPLSSRCTLGLGLQMGGGVLTQEVRQVGAGTL